MRVVADTNVLVSALIVPDSVPGRVLRAVREGSVELVLSWELAEEIAEVLRRPKLARYNLTEDDVADLLRVLAPFLPAVEVEVELRDADDAPVVGAAFAGGAEAIVTGDHDLLGDAHLREWLNERGVEVLTPAELLARL